MIRNQLQHKMTLVRTLLISRVGSRRGRRAKWSRGRRGGGRGRGIRGREDTEWIVLKHRGSTDGGCE